MIELETLSESSSANESAIVSGIEWEKPSENQWEIE